MMPLSAALLSGVAFCFLIRFLLLTNRRTGCDAYYFLLTVKEFRKQRCIPFRLPPYYLLDVAEQWYPPGFTLFLSLFPTTILRRLHYLIAPLTDCANALLLGLLTAVLSGNNTLALLAMVLYAIIPAAALPTISLNARPLGNLLFTLTLLPLLYAVHHPSWLAWVAFGIFGFALLMTHKLTMQELVGVALGFTLVFGDWRYLVALAVLFAFTLLLSGGFYRKVFLGQLEILWFWRKHWLFWEAHQVRHSPVYRIGEAPSRFYGSTLQHHLRYTRIILTANPLALFVPLLTALPVLDFWDHAFLIVIAASYLITVLTLYVPSLRFLGEGEKYLKYTAFPTALLIARHAADLTAARSLLSLLALFALCGFSLIILILKRRRAVQSYSAIGSDLEQVFAFIRKRKLDRIMCIPVFFADAVMHHCDAQVLWGSHSGGFRKLQEFFPVLQRPLAYFKRKYRLSCAILDTRYVRPDELQLRKAQRLFMAGNYAVYRL